MLYSLEILLSFSQNGFVPLPSRVSRGNSWSKNDVFTLCKLTFAVSTHFARSLSRDKRVRQVIYRFAFICGVSKSFSVCVDLKKRYMQARLTDSVKKMGKDMYDFNFWSKWVEFPPSTVPSATVNLQVISKRRVNELEDITFKLLSLLHLWPVKFD